MNAYKQRVADCLKQSFSSVFDAEVELSKVQLLFPDLYFKLSELCNELNELTNNVEESIDKNLIDTENLHIFKGQ